MVLHKVRQYINQHRLLSPEKKTLVALSGGADSVALLRLLRTMDYECEALHCNFHLRGKESDGDELFVRQLCEQLNVPLHVRHFNTREVATDRRISIEMAARELRYEWFEEMRTQLHSESIAVAHHQDDSVETVLLNLIRGTGINGLTGIQPKNGHIVRPLLCLSRSEILAYLEEINQPYVTDSSNLQDEYIRNKIRLHIIPLMEDINPAAKANILRSAHNLNEVALLYHNEIAKAKQRVMQPQGIHIRLLLKETAPQTLLFELLSPLGFNAAQVKDIFHSLTGQPGKVFLSGTHRLVKDRDLLLIEMRSDASPVQEAKEGNDKCPPFRLTMEEFPFTADFSIPQEREAACIDADKISGNLEIRPWKQGDSFVPFGMRGRKKISDYLTDKKYSRIRKEQQWVLTCGDKIVWLIGERLDDRVRVDANTRRIILIRMLPR